jgi:hypothetical protein
VPRPQLTYAKFLLGSGLGWQVRDYRGRKLVMHGGSTGTAIGLVPEEGLGVVVLTNLGCGVQYMVMHDVIDRVLGIPRTWSNREFIDAAVGGDRRARDAEEARLDRDRRAQVGSRAPLGRYAGTYASELFGPLVVKEVDGTLFLQLGPNCRTALAHWSGDRFRARFVLRFPEDWLISFHLEGDHAVNITIANVHPSAQIATFERVN